MNFIYVIHLMCWNYLIALIRLITHSRNRNNRNNSIHCNNKGARAKRARPFIVSVPAVVSVVQFDQNLDQKFDQALDQKINFFCQAASKSCVFGQLFSKPGFSETTYPGSTFLPPQPWGPMRAPGGPVTPAVLRTGHNETGPFLGPLRGHRPQNKWLSQIFLANQARQSASQLAS